VDDHEADGDADTQQQRRGPALGAVAVERALEGAGGKDVNVMGGADVIRQALDAGLVDELTVVVAPVVLGGGKRLFEGFSRSLDLEQLGVRQSRSATFVEYRVLRS
jgi:dihydrofolate reductase